MCLGTVTKAIFSVYSSLLILVKAFLSLSVPLFSLLLLLLSVPSCCCYRRKVIIVYKYRRAHTIRTDVVVYICIHAPNAPRALFLYISFVRWLCMLYIENEPYHVIHPCFSRWMCTAFTNLLSQTYTYIHPINQPKHGSNTLVDDTTQTHPQWMVRASERESANDTTMR